MAVENEKVNVQGFAPNGEPSAGHMLRMHAIPTPLILDEAELDVAKGVAPRWVLNDPKGRNLHAWLHRNGQPAGTPLHIHKK